MVQRLIVFTTTGSLAWNAYAIVCIMHGDASVSPGPHTRLQRQWGPL